MKSNMRYMLIHGVAKRLVDCHEKPENTLSDEAICEAIEGEINEYKYNVRLWDWYLALKETGMTRLIKEIRSAFFDRWVMTKGTKPPRPTVRVVGNKS